MNGNIIIDNGYKASLLISMLNMKSPIPEIFIQRTMKMKADKEVAQSLSRFKDNGSHTVQYFTNQFYKYVKFEHLYISLVRKHYILNSNHFRRGRNHCPVSVCNIQEADILSASNFIGRHH